MIAKEKAIELYERFFYAIPSMSDEGELEHKIAKQCALIAVDEIIKALEEYDERTEKNLKREFPNYFSFELQNMEQDFRLYEKVKQEIKKLC